jgi:hypothetical protein
MPCQIFVYKLVNIVTQLFIYIRSQRGVMYMKTTTLAIIVVLTAMILVTAGALNSPALAKPSSSDTGTKDTSSTKGGSSSSDTGTKDTSSTKGGSSSTTSTSSSSSVGKPLKALISCLTSASKLTGTLPTRAQFTTCESQANFGTLGGSTIGSSTSGSAKSTSGSSTGGGFVQSPSGVIGSSLGITGKGTSGSGSSSSGG